ncbi:SUN domain-containing protein 1 [Amphibalanus amphitrite]|uniref:SUN domain-containing protein 1 n=1 Tax=Amphibalanus amphitrite TaxID=1232801 RepID=A0A6A4WW12_AMPAM|nr:SUN domain-containing protein 1 [Amphibalanus amphitrite]
MGDELFLRSRCSGGAGCHCAGMEHFYVPDSTDRAPPTSSRGRRVSGQVGGALNDSMHSIKSSSTRPAPARSAGAAAASQDCTAALLASVFDQVSGAETDDRPARSRRVRRPARKRRHQEESQMDTSGLPDLSYLAYSSDEEFEEFMKQPRTDYTYSRSLSYTAVRPEPVGPPSMSRLGLRSPSQYGAGDSPLPAARTAPSRADRGAAQAAACPALVGDERGDSTLGLSPGLDADSQDEEWLPTDGVSKLGAHRCSTPYKTRPGWSVRRCARQALSPLLRLWLALTAVCHYLWTSIRPLFLAPVSKAAPGSGSRGELWRRSGSLLAGSGGDPGAGSRAGAGGPSGESGAGGAAVKEGREVGGWRCLPLATAALLLLLLTVLLLLPFLGWLGGEGGESPAELLLPAGRWPLPDADSVKQFLWEVLSSLAGGVSSLAGGVSYLLGGILAGLTSMAEGLITIGIYGLAAVQVAVAQLAGAVGSAGAVLWAPLTSGSAPAPLPPPTPAAGTEPSPAPAEVAVPPAAGDADRTLSDPRLSEVLVQMDELKVRLELLQEEYQSCRSAVSLPPSAAAVRAALGLPSDSAPLTTDRLEAAEARLRGRLESELAAVRALLDREDGGRDVQALLARLTALEEAVPAAQRQRSRLDAEGRAAAARLGSLEQELGDLRAELAHLQGALSAAREALQRTGSCCNGTAADWSGTVGAELGRMESQLLDRMQLFTTNFRKDLTADLPSLTGAAVAAAAGGSGGGGGGISREEALAIAQHELALYDADKTGQFDFALESAGGSVLSTKCTEAYTVRSARLTVLGVPLWYPSNNPRSIIQPHGRPGECFAFHGEGQFVIGLSRPVRPTEFVIEHIARGLTPGGRIDSAPRHCSVLAVTDDGEPATLLASFEYSAAGPPLQRFAATPTDRPVSAVELRVISNWGHPEYTCLYRFRVHGQPEGGAR